ncbi:MAG: type II toxin-antitoxin system HicB family antitoxin [Xanthomonadaceae bacterium]|jgi:predicted RNase H-like HicB family nuclease|nr:type II toxin-antitoxin system HicB family antitoxin [Xanthomonadaceae bacterium]
MKFLIAIEPGTDDTAFGVIVPDLPGCFSAGDSLEEAFTNAVEAIDGHVEIMIEDGASLPAPTDPMRHMADHGFEGMVWGFVDVPVEKHFGPAERVNITVPSRFLERIDAFAKTIGDSRSGLILRAARAYMESHAKPPKVFPAKGVRRKAAPKQLKKPAARPGRHRVDA